jgi:hypothetical protein
LGKILRFWLNYRGKYFYFETRPEIESIVIKVPKREITKKEVVGPFKIFLEPEVFDEKIGETPLVLGVKSFYKLIGKINKVPNFHPSLHLREVKIKKMIWDFYKRKYVPEGKEEKRNNYGLILDRIWYYEEIGSKDKLKSSWVLTVFKKK